ncbi:MAG: hypothetical protein NXI24_25170 [bacterium]|nr:hypothetical protein [bacterium]
MRCEKHAFEFPAWAADAAMSRYVGRQRKFAANPLERKHHNRPPRTWSYACMMALAKMRYRHNNLFRESRPPDLQAFAASRERRRLARKKDPVAAWADAEYRILERFHGRQARDRRPEQFEAAIWVRVVELQRWKIRRLEQMLRPPRAERKADWEAVIRNALYFRLRKKT